MRKIKQGKGEEVFGVWDAACNFLYKMVEKASLRRWHLSKDPNHVDIWRRGRDTRKYEVPKVEAATWRGVSEEDREGSGD